MFCSCRGGVHVCFCYTGRCTRVNTSYWWVFDINIHIRAHTSRPSFGLAGGVSRADRGGAACGMARRCMTHVMDRTCIVTRCFAMTHVMDCRCLDLRGTMPTLVDSWSRQTGSVAGRITCQTSATRAAYVEKKHAHIGRRCRGIPAGSYKRRTPPSGAFKGQ